MTDKNLPDYIKDNQDGTVTITFAKPHTVNGEQVAAVTMREPLVEDQLAVQGRTSNGAQFELSLFAQLCDFAPDDFKSMTMRNYIRLQKGYSFFID